MINYRIDLFSFVLDTKFFNVLNAPTQLEIFWSTWQLLLLARTLYHPRTYQLKISPLHRSTQTMGNALMKKYSCTLLLNWINLEGKNVRNWKFFFEIFQLTL